jgi:hypothetical protein
VALTRHHDLGPVIRKEVEEVSPPSAHSLVPAIVALQRTEARLDVDLVVHEREQRIEVTAVEDLNMSRARSTFSRDIVEPSIA